MPRLRFRMGEGCGEAHPARFRRLSRMLRVELVAGKNYLATLFPRIAEEWHPGKNPLPPSGIFSDYRQRIWWLGKCGHEWCAPIAKRVGSAVGRLRPYCSDRKALSGFNDLATTPPPSS